MPLIFRRDASDRCGRDSFRVEDNPSEEIIILSLFPRDVPLSRYKDGFFCILGSEYYWELRVIDPSTLPVYSWLRGSKPWVAENCFLLSKFSEIKSKVGMVVSRLYL